MIEPFRGEDSTPTRFIQIDEDGYFMMDGLKVSDAEIGRSWISSVRMDDRGRAWCTVDGQAVLIEAFDQPFVAHDIEITDDGDFFITVPYGHREAIQAESFCVDEWDRFLGRTKSGVPFALSRAAQVHFFNLADEFDDMSITIRGKKYETPAWLRENPDANNSNWWSEIYRNEEPRWELGAPSVALPLLVPRLKLQKSRILVAGAGSANDAAWFAQQGHLVTAVDFSEEAITRAQAKYQHIEGLKFLRADVFHLPESMAGGFDIVFEHTLYCAITPGRRSELVKVWRRVLSENGFLMGVFFAMDKPVGPPFGGSEFEIRNRLAKSFRPLYWTRLRESLPKRLGHELFVYAQKLNAF